MHILIPDLHEDRPGFGQQVTRHRQPIAQIRQIGMDAIAPRIPERLHLLRLAGDVLRIAVLHVAARRAPLEIRVEFDPVRRIEIDALHLAPQALALRQRRHHPQTVPQDHPVLPMPVVPIELRARILARQPVEIGEQIGRESALPHLRLGPLGRRTRGLALQILDQHLRMHLLLDVERRRLHPQLRLLILRILAPPDQLRIQIAVATRVGHADRTLLVAAHHRLQFGRRDVLARRVLVADGVDGERGGGGGRERSSVLLGRHDQNAVPEKHVRKGKAPGVRRLSGWWRGRTAKGRIG